MTRISFLFSVKSAFIRNKIEFKWKLKEKKNMVDFYQRCRRKFSLEKKMLIRTNSKMIKRKQQQH